MKFDKLTQLIERAILREECPPAPGVSGQQSEANLVAAVDNYINANGGPFTIDVNMFGSLTITGATKLGGGANESKADVKINTTGDPLYISMKKPNFGAILSWATGKTLLDYLTQAGLSPEHALQVIDDRLIPKAKAISKEERAVIVAEKIRWTKLAQTVEPNYQYPDDFFYQTNPKLKKAMMETPGWHDAKNPKSPEAVPNHYVPMMDIVGEDAWRNVVSIAVAGDARNPQRANSVLVCGVSNDLIDPANWMGSNLATSIQTLKDIFAETITIDKAIDDYADPTYPKGIMFRLRPITRTRASFNRDSNYRYRIACKGGGKMKGEEGAGFWCNEEIGWLVQIIPKKQGAEEKAKSVAMAKANKKFFEEPDEGWEAYYNEFVSFEDMSPEEQERAMRGGEEAAGYSQFEEHNTKHLTSPPLSYKMLSEMIDHLMSDE